MNKPIEKPILFSGPMVRAILDGTKTMTRRVVKIPYEKGNSLGTWEPSILGGKGCTDNNGNFVDEFPVLWHTRTGYSLSCPYGQVGDRLWVRETWAWGKRYDDCIITLETIPKQKPDYAEIFYRADNNQVNRDDKWKPSIFMPRWASRITLEIVSVRVERLQEITEEDAIKEGALSLGDPSGEADWSVGFAKACFQRLWDSINGKKYPWKDNPFVWVIEFRRIDAL